MSLFSMFFFISLYLQQVLHYSAIKTGPAYLPLSIGIILAAGGSSKIVTRVGFKPPLVAGMLWSVAACCGSLRRRPHAARSLPTSWALHYWPPPVSASRLCL